MRTKQVVSIQYFRAAASLMIVTFHQLQIFKVVEVMFSHTYDIFFVISGFIMFALTAKKTLAPSRFLLDRLTRIMPLYWVALVVSLVMGLIGFSDPFVWDFSLPRLAKSILLVPSYDGRGHIWPLLYLSWSLSFELLFYSIFAMVLIAPTTLRLLALSAVLLCLVVLGYILAPVGAIAATITSPLSLEFLGGACLGAIFGADLNLRSTRACCLLALLTCLLAVSVTFVVPEVVPGAVTMVALCLVMLVEKRGKLPEVKFLIVIADASFSIYLFQQVAFDLSRVFLQSVEAMLERHISWTLQRCIAVAAAVALGFLARRFIEKPMTAWCRKQVSRLTVSPVSIASR